MSEAEEIAATLPPLPPGATWQLARETARRYLEEEASMQMIDNVAEALLREVTRQ